MPVIFSPQLLLVSMLNSLLRGLDCSNNSPWLSRNIRIGAWLLPKILSLTPLPKVKVMPAMVCSLLSVS